MALGDKEGYRACTMALKKEDRKGKITDISDCELHSSHEWIYPIQIQRYSENNEEIVLCEHLDYVENFGELRLGRWFLGRPWK
jgi:hypothetical protein